MNESLENAKKIIKTLIEHGYVAYFAGGWVRDHVMGNDPSDVDIATNAEPEEVSAIFKKTVKVGASFGVVVVILNNHFYEVATFRKDINYTNGRAPDTIEFCSPKEDALRRDFTINGLFYNPLTHEVLDFVGGVKDIKERTIRTIGDPYERFREDRLRMIRAFRFAARFQFVIDKETEDAIFANAETLFPAVSMERIWQELYKMSQYPNFDHALIEMHRLELLGVIFPQLKELHLNEIKKRILIFKRLPSKTPTILYLYFLFKESSKEEMIEICRYLKTSNKEIEYLTTFFIVKKLIFDERENNRFDPFEWVHYWARNDAFLCFEIATSIYSESEQAEYIKIHKKRLKNFSTHIDRIITNNPIISGKLLLSLGLPPGKKLGILLNEAERYAILNDIQNPDIILAYLKNSHYWSD